MKWRLFALATLPAICVGGITYMLASGPRASAVGDPHANEEAEAPAPQIPGIKLVSSRAGVGWDTLELPARVTTPPERSVRVGSRVPGRLVGVYRTVGDAVRRGEVMAQVASPDLAEARSRRREALARLDAARKSLAREQEIVELGAVSARPIEEARTADTQAQSALAEARAAAAEARADISRAEAELAQCEARLRRARDLYADQLISKQDLEAAEAEHKRDAAALAASKARADAADGKLRSASDAAALNSEYVAREKRIFGGRSLDLRALQAVRSLVDTAEAELASADARIRALGATPSGSGDLLPIVAPASGRVLTRDAHAGAVVEPSDTLFTVADLGAVWVEADVFEQDLAKVRRGQQVEIRTSAEPDRILPARVDWVSETLDPQSRAARARCVVANDGGRLRAEMSATVSVMLGRRGASVFVPRAAVLDDAGSKIVYTPCTECAADRQAGKSVCGAYDRVVVTTGAVRGSEVEVLSGLTPGTRVVAVGQHQIRAAMSSGTLKAGCTDH